MVTYAEDLQPGMSGHYVHIVTEKDIELFGEVSGDRNPAHFDEDYARTTIFKTRVAHGMLSAGYISTVLGMEMPGPGTIFLSLNLQFKAPVRIGDEVETMCTVREVREKRRVLFDCLCSVKGLAVIEGEALVMAPARPKA